MLKIDFYGSSSKGNCLVLEDNENSIMVDCGVKNVEKKIDIDKLNGILISHAHLDHCKNVKTLKDYVKCPFYSHKECLDTLPLLDPQKKEIRELEPINIGNFKVVATDLYHDVKNYMYLIKHIPSNMKILYATDTSSFDNISTKDVDIFCIECHHDNKWIEEKEDIDFIDMRNYSDYGHLSLQDCLQFLKNNVNINTKYIFLIHISSSYSNYKEFEKIVQKEFPNVKVMAINPQDKNVQEIVLKEDLQGFDFD